MKNVFQAIVNHFLFNTIVIVAIILAGVNVGLQTYSEFYSDYKTLSDGLDNLILLIFIIEIAIKILAEGDKPLKYFNNSWNVFDFTIVVLCLLPFDTQFLAVMRMIRLFRVLRLISVLPQLRLLVHTLLKSIPSIGNIMILLLLHFYIYGAMATFLFSTNDPLHFGDLHTSILSLFRAVTLEDWTDLMYINMYGCNQYGYDDSSMIPCTQPEKFLFISPVFFVSFVLTGSMIVLNLFIGVIMTSMEEGKADMMMKELIEKQQKGEFTMHEEIVMIEEELQELSRKMRTLNGRLFNLLDKVKKVPIENENNHIQEEVENKKN